MPQLAFMGRPLLNSNQQPGLGESCRLGGIKLPSGHCQAWPLKGQNSSRKGGVPTPSLLLREAKPRMLAILCSCLATATEGIHFLKLSVVLLPFFFTPQVFIFRFQNFFENLKHFSDLSKDPSCLFTAIVSWYKYPQIWPGWLLEYTSRNPQGLVGRISFSRNESSSSPFLFPSPHPPANLLLSPPHLQFSTLSLVSSTQENCSPLAQCQLTEQTQLHTGNLQRPMRHTPFSCLTCLTLFTHSLHMATHIPSLFPSPLSTHPPDFYLIPHFQLYIFIYGPPFPQLVPKPAYIIILSSILSCEQGQTVSKKTLEKNPSTACIALTYQSREGERRRQSVWPCLALPMQGGKEGKRGRPA